MMEGQKKERICVMASMAMIIPSAFLFYVVSDLPHVFIITCLGFILSLLFSSTVKYTDRSIIYSLLIALVLAVVLNMIFPMKQERFFSIGRLFMSQVTVPLLLYLAVISTFYESTPYTLGINAAFSIIIIMLGGDFRQSTPVNEVSMFASLLERKQFNFFFLLIVAIDSLAMLFAFNLARKSLFHKTTNGFAIKKKAIITVAITGAAGVAIGLFALFNSYKDDLKKLEQYLTSLRRFQGALDSKVLFSREIDLNRTINSDLRKNSKQIMLRAEGKTPPGYLRGRSYQYYNKGKWREAQDIPKQMNFKINVDGLAFNAFFVKKDPGRSSSKFDIFPTSNCLAKYLFFPANTQRFEIVADRLTYTKNGHIVPQTWEKDGGYTTYVSEIDQAAAYPTPDEGLMTNYLQIPKDLNETISNTASAINQKLPKMAEKQTDQVIADQIVTFFNDNFSYSLDPEAPEKGTDPIQHFIVNSKKGHCELFATSAVLLLRHYGIPARYCTGFICSEPHPSSQYFIARLGNAHAWAEAYLRDEKRWVLIEATPASGVNPFGHKWGFFEVWIDRLKQAAQKMFANVRRGYIARAVLAFMIDLLLFVWEIFWHPVRGIILITGFLFLYWFIKYYKRRKQHLIVKLEQEIIDLQTEFNKIQSMVGKKTGIQKAPSDTVQEWLKQLKAKKILPEKALFKFIKSISVYRQLRFSTASINQDDINKIRKSFRDVKNSL